MNKVILCLLCILAWISLCENENPESLKKLINQVNHEIYNLEKRLKEKESSIRRDSDEKKTQHSKSHPVDENEDKNLDDEAAKLLDELIALYEQSEDAHSQEHSLTPLSSKSSTSKESGPGESRLETGVDPVGTRVVSQEEGAAYKGSVNVNRGKENEASEDGASARDSLENAGDKSQYLESKMIDEGSMQAEMELSQVKEEGQQTSTLMPTLVRPVKRIRFRVRYRSSATNRVRYVPKVRYGSRRSYTSRRRYSSAASRHYHVIGGASVRLLLFALVVGPVAYFAVKWL